MRTGLIPQPLLACALIAYSVYEHQEGYAQHIDVWLRADSFTVQDDGRGMGLDREGYVEGLMGLLVGRPGVVQLHGIGLSLIATSTPRLEVESRRRGSLWKQSFSWGIADGPPLQELLVDGRTGTRITALEATGAPLAEFEQLRAQIDRWRESNPELTITLY